MREVRIAGVGLTPHGHFPEVSWLMLAKSAVGDAQQSSTLPDDCQIYLGSALLPLVSGEQFFAATLAAELGLRSAQAVDVGGGEAAGMIALRQAWLDVASGACDCALAVGVDHWSSLHAEIRSAALASLISVDASRDVVAGLTASEFVGQCDDRRQALDTIARKNRSNAVHNAKAFHRTSLDPGTLDSAPGVAAPLTTAHAADLVDGAAAVLLVADSVAQSDWPVQTVQTVRIGAVTTACSEQQGVRRAFSAAGTTRKAAELAYAQADCRLDSIDVFEVYDAYAIYELLSLAGLGWGETHAVDATLSGATDFESASPVNPSGGLLGLGHALGAGGLAQVVSVAEQVAGQAGVMQVQDCRRGLAQTIGGGGAVAAIAILERCDG
jgi:acetyl-CoA C-acetyltransferase